MFFRKNKAGWKERDVVCQNCGHSSWAHASPPGPGCYARSTWRNRLCACAEYITVPPEEA